MIYSENIFLIKKEDYFTWYISDKDQMLSEFFELKDSKEFISNLENKKFPIEFLRALFAECIEDINDISSLKNMFPKCWMDFDDKYISIRLGEDYRTYDEFMPEDWTVDYNNYLPNYIPENLAYWIIDGKDYFITFSEP